MVSKQQNWVDVLKEKLQLEYPAGFVAEPSKDQASSADIVPLVHLNVQPQKQEGPSCGILALSIGVTALLDGTRSPLQSSLYPKLFDIARELQLTRNGELFNAHAMPEMTKRLNFDLQHKINARVVEWQSEDELVHILKDSSGGLRNRMVLVPYDKDGNHEPCERLGNRAHWCLVIGLVHVVPTETFPHVVAFHGQSLRPALWSLRKLFESNGQLYQVRSSVMDTREQWILPNDQGDLRETLCSKVVVIEIDSI